jgi:response regulator RpfG family c-di-GMP phosphodiesterase
MKNEKINVLYVDDEVDNLNAFKAVFRRDFNVFIVETAEEGVEILRNNEIEVILTDQRMPNVTGIEFLASILDEFPEAMRILVTGYSDISTVIDAINKGHVYRYVSKPWNNDDFKIIIEQAAEVYKLRKEKRQLTEDLIRTQGQLEFMLRQKLSSS